jgi:diguanylate cyclase (GGDEF)-like protein
MTMTLDAGVRKYSLTVATKRALLVASHAMERAFQDLGTGEVSGTRPPGATSRLATDQGLLIAFFQRREYFDLEASRYEALAAQGHTVIVAFTGSVDSVPAGITAVSLPPDDVCANDWVLTMVRGGFAATLTAHDLHQLSPTETTLEASRLFTSWTTMQRRLALENTRKHLDHLARRLPPAQLARARALIEGSASLPVSEVEDRLAVAADHLLRSVDAGYQHASTVRLELESTKSMAERDQLTGLHNRHYLERYLGHGDKPADLLALLVDVDGLKQVNDGFGHEAGDALLRCVASTLRSNTRSGDVLIRWGGDEFLLLIPQLAAEAGLQYGERLASAIAAGTVDEPWQDLEPSASIGVSPARQTPLPMSQLDAALYHVKRSGKGHAGLAPAEETPAPAPAG